MRRRIHGRWDKPYYLSMIPSRWQLACAAAFLTLVAVGFALLVTESAAGAVVAAGAVWLSLWVHLALHEGAHLVTALAVRVPVVAVRIAPFGGWRNEVLTRPSPAATALPAGSSPSPVPRAPDFRPAQPVRTKAATSVKADKRAVTGRARRGLNCTRRL
ncbi:hypothetical protein GCM10009558_054780 [Virgisporangium aurantiacum]